MSSITIDLNTLNELKEIMEDDFDELIETFIKDGQSQIDLLREAIDSSSVVDIRRIAHTLKGSSAILGAHALSEVCKELEYNAAENIFGDVEESFVKIKNEYDAVKSLLNENF